MVEPEWESVEFSSLPQARLALLSQGKTPMRAVEAETSRSKSISKTKSIAQRIGWILNYFIELRAWPSVALKGEIAAIIFSGYVESLAGRGRAVQATTRHALTFRADELRNE